MLLLSAASVPVGPRGGDAIRADEAADPGDVLHHHALPEELRHPFRHDTHGDGSARRLQREHDLNRLRWVVLLRTDAARSE